MWPPVLVHMIYQFLAEHKINIAVSTIALHLGEEGISHGEVDRNWGESQMGFIYLRSFVLAMYYL